MSYWRIVYLSILSVFLSACAAGLVVYDKRSIKTIELDGHLAHRIQVDILKSFANHDARVRVISFNQTVLLIGQVANGDVKSSAQRIALNTADVHRVYNELAIMPPIPLSQRSLDTLISTQIRSQMLATKGLSSGSIRVVTENGVVYLLGSVSRNQAELAVSIARSVQGVVKVVKMYQYLA